MCACGGGGIINSKHTQWWINLTIFCVSIGKYTPLGVCIVATGWGLTTINSSPRALALRAHYSFYLTLAETLVGKERTDGWGSLNTRKAGKRLGSLAAWTWTSQYVELHEL